MVLLVVFVCSDMEEMEMYLANLDVKFAIKKNGLTQKRVANEMGISYSYFTKLLQYPLEPRFKKMTNDALQRLIDRQSKKAVVKWYENPKSGLLGDDYYKGSGSTEK